MMTERERREFKAGLSEEVDAWLRGDTSRRSVPDPPGADGRRRHGARPRLHRRRQPAWADAVDLSKVELADQSTPLGQAQAAAVKASTEGPTDGSAYRAVQAAQKFKGKNITLNMTYEAGLQALEPKNFSGPLWQALTGINFNVVELPHPDQYSKPIAEHIANSGAYDVLDIEPAWIPSLANGGVIMPIDDYVDKIHEQGGSGGLPPALQVHADLQGQALGLLRRRRPVLRSTTARTYSRTPSCRPPTRRSSASRWRCRRPGTTIREVAQFITDQLAPNVYGAAHFRKFGSPGNQFAFLQEFRANGGKFFDDDMKAQLAGPAGVTTLKQMIAQNKASIPGNNDLDAVAQWAAWLQGKVAMIFSWPPTGRMTENYSQRAKAINFVPQVGDRRQGRLRGRAGRQRRNGDPATSRRWPRVRTTRRRPICSCNG